MPCGTYKRPELKLNEIKAKALETLLKDDYFSDRLGCCEDILSAYKSGKKAK